MILNLLAKEKGPLGKIVKKSGPLWMSGPLEQWTSVCFMFKDWSTDTNFAKSEKEILETLLLIISSRCESVTKVNSFICYKYSVWSFRFLQAHNPDSLINLQLNCFLYGKINDICVFVIARVSTWLVSA